MSGIHVTSEIGKLKKVCLHRPGDELLNLPPFELERLLFDDVPFLEVAQQEHDTFAELMRGEGVEVVYLEKMVAEIFDEKPELRAQFLDEYLAEAGIVNPAYVQAAREKLESIEDNLEIRYAKINPGKDCVELKVDQDFTYTKAIKACLRQLPEWILLSEARSVEVKYLLESMSTGTHCLTTLHTDDVRKIPDRIKNMMPTINEQTENDIYSFINVGIQVRSYITDEGVQRKIAQVALFSRDRLPHARLFVTAIRIPVYSLFEIVF